MCLHADGKESEERVTMRTEATIVGILEEVGLGGRLHSGQEEGRK